MDDEARFVHKTKPYKHQIDAVHFLYGKPYFAEFCEQGTGKSKILIDIASNLYLEHQIDAVMIIAPNGVQSQWANEQIPIHSPIPYTDYVWEATNSATKLRELKEFTMNKADTLKWFCVNVEAFSRDTHLNVFKTFLKFNRTFLVIDEATRIKNPTAQRTINITQGLSEVTKVGRRITSVSPLSVYRAILTGTMVTNSPYDIWSMFDFLDHSYLGMDYYSFKAHYGIERRINVPGSYKSYTKKITSKEIASVRQYLDSGKTVEEVARIMALSESSVMFLHNNRSVNAPYKNLDELKAKIAPVAFIVRKADCLDLPPKIYSKIYIDLTTDQVKAYRELCKNLTTQYEGVELNVLNKITLLGRLSQITGGFFPGQIDNAQVLTPFASNPKLDALIDDLDECSDFPVIVVASHVAEIKMIYEKLKKVYEDDRIDYICGEIDREQRNEIIESFKRGDVKILIANASTIGTGYNLQVSHVQYFYSNSYSMEEREQVEDRIHRDGQKSDTVVYKDIVARNTIDEKILAILKQKKDLLEYMRDKKITEFIGAI